MRLLTLCLVSLVFFISVPLVAIGSDGDMFYCRFRNAVLKSEINSVVALTRFPFEVRGTDDGQGVRRYEESGFRKLFVKLIGEKRLVLKNGHVVQNTMYQTIREKEKLTRLDYLSNSFVRIGDFEFQLLEGEWKFTGAYLE